MSSVAVNRVEVTVKISTAVATDASEATVKQVLGISPSGNPAKYLNEQGNWATPAGGGGSAAWGSITGTLSSQTDLQTALNGKQASGDYATNTALNSGLATKQNSLGFTPEDSANKSTTTADSASAVKFPVWAAVVSYVTGLGYITSAALSGYATQAWVQAQGYITNVVTALGFTPENVANKKTDLTDNSDIFYPSQKAVKTAVDAKQDALGFTPPPNTRSISTSSPLSGGGNLTADRTLSIADAAADGSTKGAAAFTAVDFNSASGVISIDYANGQKATALQAGFLSSTDFSTFNAKQAALNGTGFVRQDGAATTYDTLSRLRTFSQTCAEVSLTATTAETITDTITIAANTLSANDIIQIYSRFLKTTTAIGTARLYVNTAANLSGATLLGTAQLSATNRFAGFDRQIICKASGLIEVYGATTSQATDKLIANQTETTTTITYSSDNYIIITMQLNNSADTMRRSFLQVQHQRQAS